MILCDAGVLLCAVPSEPHLYALKKGRRVLQGDRLSGLSMKGRSPQLLLME